MISGVGRVLAIVFCITLSASVLAQSGSETIELNWTGVTRFEVSEDIGISLLHFEGAGYHLGMHNNPIYSLQREFPGRPARVSATITNAEYEPVSTEERAVLDIDSVFNDIVLRTSIGFSRGQALGEVSFIPIRRNERTGSIEKLIRFDIQMNVSGSVSAPPRQARSSGSVMAQGDWYRIGVPRDGIYRITYDFLQNIGVDVNGINPDQLNIYGNGVGLLPRQNSVPRPDDLQANAIEIVGGEDGSFDPGDYILFYARGPHRWNYNQTDDEFRHVKHLYTDTSYYFIAVDAGAPKRITSVSGSSLSATHTVEGFDDYMFHELDLVNHIKSGRTWYGETFDIQNTYSFSGDAFTFPNIQTNEEAIVRTRVCGRTIGLSNSSSFNMSVAGMASSSVVVPAISGHYTASYAQERDLVLNFNPTNPAFNISITFNPHSSSSKGWLDYISINVRRSMVMSGNQMAFRDMKTVGTGNVAGFTLTQANSVRRIWDVTDPVNAQSINYGSNAPIISFNRPANVLREYIATTDQNFPSPTFFGKTPNQNLHALANQQPLDMIIVTHPMFYGEAMDLASFHSSYPDNPVYTQVVTNQQVYNEFSSGMPDITAIKDLMRMLYESANGNEELMPKYLLLFGDGSYDNRSRAASNTNFVLTYQTENSLSPLLSYVSDDYFGLLDFNEGEAYTDKVDLGVGRITVKTRQEAQDVVRKIKHYMTPDFTAEVAHCSGVGATVFGEWRNRVVMVGDDEDVNIHMWQADSLARMIESNYPDFNVIKIMLDAYQQISTPGGNRYPDVNDAIRENVARGALIMNYVGHGGEVGWAHERILDVSTIRNWENFNSLPLFMTATCEFTRFDDPGRTSAGEYVLLNPNGAGVSLLSTTRLVLSSGNFNLAQVFYNNVFKHKEIPDLRLGDICRATKVGSQNSVNKRSFMLIGDPALRLVYPEKKVYTTSITDTLGTPLDTLKALGNVKISGYVGNDDGSVLNDFNGVVTVTVYDKKSEITTLANDGGSPFVFKAFQNVIYRGKAGVNNGYFDLTFIVPRDINLAIESTGRISYYAVSDQYDAHGHTNNITIGGFDENAALDDVGPEVQIFMNDENFVFGGMTDESPVIFAKLFDESGINMVGTGIGHDLSAYLNDNTSESIILNDYYESDLDTYKSGTIRYQLNDLEEGLHKLRIKAWDVHNNSGEGYTEFIVAQSEDFVLSHILNYPNPFTTYTEFSFEHNQVCTFLNVQIQVFTISGKLVKTLSSVANTNGFRIDPIAWNGLDDYGDQLARGVYVYKVKVRNPAGESVEKFEKLVILK